MSKFSGNPKVTFTLEERAAGVKRAAQELSGRQLHFPASFATGNSLSELDFAEGDSRVVARAKRAFRRDALHAMSTPAFIRKFGTNQSVRQIYDYGKIIFKNLA